MAVVVFFFFFLSCDAAFFEFFIPFNLFFYFLTLLSFPLSDPLLTYKFDRHPSTMLVDPLILLKECSSTVKSGLVKLASADTV